jgi:hypothetical protein
VLDLGIIRKFNIEVNMKFGKKIKYYKFDWCSSTNSYSEDFNDKVWVRVMVFNVTFNNISVISWRSVLLVEETGVPRKKSPTCRKSLTNFIT